MVLAFTNGTEMIQRRCNYVHPMQWCLYYHVLFSIQVLDVGQLESCPILDHFFTLTQTEITGAPTCFDAICMSCSCAK